VQHLPACLLLLGLLQQVYRLLELEPEVQLEQAPELQLEQELLLGVKPKQQLDQEQPLEPEPELLLKLGPKPSDTPPLEHLPLRPALNT
jgi:hypothetical protein